MKRVSLFGASAVAIAASMLNGAGEALASAARGVHRVAAGTKRARRMVSVKTPHNRSKYMPHIGAKEQQRAKRFHMVDTHPSGTKRSAPTMQQHSTTWFF
jgi:hypothetical protein